MNWFYSPWASDQADRTALRQAGFSEREIDRLCQTRRAWKPNEKDGTALDLHQAHLRFLRWLFQEGKLTEELS